jgi:hypothetical protein
MSSPQYTITMHEGAYDVLKACLAKVEDTTDINAADSYETLANAQRKALALQANLLRNLVRLLQSTDYDGDLSLAVDGPMSLFFRHQKSGYHGAMIFHPNSGEWQIHT